MKKNEGSVWIVLLSVVAIGALAGAVYLYGQNQSLKSESSVVTPSPSVKSSPAPSAYATATPSTSKATVVFEAEGSFTQTEKDELKKKVIDPLLDYYIMESDQVLLTLTISKNDKASKDQYPYQGRAVFQGGGNMGFLIMKLGTGVDWWYPECLNGCTLSASYKLKYPEIASKVQ